MSGFTLKLRACREDVSPEKLAKIHNYAPGFAEHVRKVQKTAEGLWGWCTVEVVAQYKYGDKVLEAIESLGGCSYFSAADFMISNDYFSDMVKRAIAELREKMEKAGLKPTEKMVAEVQVPA